MSAPTPGSNAGPGLTPAPKEASKGDAKVDTTKFPEGYPRGRTAGKVPTINGPEYARGTIEQTSPAPHYNDVIAAAAGIASGAISMEKVREISDVPDTDKTLKEAESLGVNYQQAGQVRQLLAERANAVAYKKLDRVASIDDSLDAIGYTGDREAGASGQPGPLGRTSRPDKTLRSDAPTGSKSAEQAGTAGTGVAASSTAKSGTTTPAASPANTAADSSKKS
jgi:hypothetical protein